MNLLQVVGICGGGTGRHVRGLCEGLVAHGHHVTIVYAPHGLDQSFQDFVNTQKDVIRFVPLDIRREISPLADLKSLVGTLRLIRREGPCDVIHGHSSKGGAIARIAGRLSGVPTVYTPHSLIMASPRLSRTERLLYQTIELVLGRLATSRIIAVSEDERRFILDLKLTAPHRTVLIQNGIDERMLAQLSEESTRETQKDRPLTFGSTMRFEDQKDPGNLIEAFARLHKALPDISMKLVIAGDGNLFAQTRMQVEQSGLEEYVTLLGWRNEVEELLRNLDVFVLPSLYEGFSYSLLEAMAAKLPVVSTSVFGAQDALSGVPGNVVVPTGDSAALAQGMKQIAATANYKARSEELCKIGRANHDYVQAHFTQSEVTRCTEEVYEDLAH